MQVITVENNNKKKGDLLGHRRAKVRDTPDFATDGTVSNSHYRQRQNKDKNKHVQLVNLPADWAVPITNAPKSRFANPYWQMYLSLRIIVELVAYIYNLYLYRQFDCYIYTHRWIYLEVKRKKGKEILGISVNISETVDGTFARAMAIEMSNLNNLTRDGQVLRIKYSPELRFSKCVKSFSTKF